MFFLDKSDLIYHICTVFDQSDGKQKITKIYLYIRKLVENKNIMFTLKYHIMLLNNLDYPKI